MFKQKISWYFVLFLRNVEYVYFYKSVMLKSLHCLFYIFLLIYLYLSPEAGLSERAKGKFRGMTAKLHHLMQPCCDFCHINNVLKTSMK